ncbi:insulin-induced protein-domain-containing protein [Phlyctochytrium arcticum]|nr:insulin-induced protein-domain-containing protein [Phlyctochytrium arcticum]
MSNLCTGLVKGGAAVSEDLASLTTMSACSAHLRKHSSPTLSSSKPPFVPSLSNPTRHSSSPPKPTPQTPLGHLSHTLLLFLLGGLFALIIDKFQQSHDITRYPATTALWVPLCCGGAGAFIGSLYPVLDRHFGYARPVGWSNILRCCGGFVGVNYATSKLPWTSTPQVSLVLALSSVWLWLLFDRSSHGFFFSLTVAFIGTSVAQSFVNSGLYSFTQADFGGVRSWFPCMLYSGSVLFGAIGRQLASTKSV